MSDQIYKVALVGNPNVGKSSIFNQLTGLRQKVANFPGVTVDKKIGKFLLHNQREIQLVDLPGTYSLYPTTSDEKVVASILSNRRDDDFPDAIIYVADCMALEKHLLLLTQIKDLGVPVIAALNFSDVAQKENLSIDIKKLSDYFNIPFFFVSGRYGLNIEQIKTEIQVLTETQFLPDKLFYTPTSTEASLIQDVRSVVEVKSPYQALVIAHHYYWLPFLDAGQKKSIQASVEQHNFHDLRLQIDETMRRFDTFTPIAKKTIKKFSNKAPGLTDRIDTIVTNRYLGPIIFFTVMFFVFQAIFSFSKIPMDFIESSFDDLTTMLKSKLPTAWWASLLTDGILSGIKGILIFVPQITILFLLLSILEELGYMARAVYMFDNVMQRFGLNGRSIVALISGGACAIPAIMATRTIENKKERLITILVTPFISCSARLPVYSVLVGFVVSPIMVFGFLNAQALVFMGLYLIGIITALGSAFILKKVMKLNDYSTLMIELPQYRKPSLKNIILNLREKVGSFVFGAGKMIMIISMILWVLSNFAPGNQKEEAEIMVTQIAQNQHLSEQETADLIAAKQIEVSYAGHLGKFIEPVIRPLGFDWKIGIALITSFAAREVFVGTMSTIYSIGSADGDSSTIREKMAKEINPNTGKPMFTMSVALSLLVFYVFALQCMSTISIVKRETQSWKWALFQFFFMGGLAYLSSFAVYQLL